MILNDATQIIFGYYVTPKVFPNEKRLLSTRFDFAKDSKLLFMRSVCSRHRKNNECFFAELPSESACTVVVDRDGAPVRFVTGSLVGQGVDSVVVVIVVVFTQKLTK